MSCQDPKNVEASTPAKEAGRAVPRNGSGADTAFLAMVRKRKGQAGEATDGSSIAPANTPVPPKQ